MSIAGTIIKLLKRPVSTRLSYNYKAFIVLILSIILVVCTIFTYLIYKNQEEIRRENLKAAAKLIEGHVQRLFGNVYNDAQYLGNKISISGKNTIPNIAYLLGKGPDFGKDSIYGNYPGWSGFSFVDINGRVIVDSNGTIVQSPDAIIEENYLYKSKLFPFILHFGEVRVSNKTYGYEIPCAMGFINNKNQYIGSIITSFTVDSMYGAIDDILQFSPVKFLIVNEGQKTILKSKIETDSVNNKLNRKYDSELGGYITALPFENKEFNYIKPLADYPFAILLGYDDNFAMQQLVSGIWPFGIVILIAGMLSIIMLRRFYISGLVPIIKLSELADRNVAEIAKGGAFDFDVERLLMGSPYEVKNIGNRIAKVLEVTYELRKTRDEIERSRMEKEQFLSTIRNEFKDSLVSSLSGIKLLENHVDPCSGVTLSNYQLKQIIFKLNTSLLDAVNLTRHIVNCATVNLKDVIESCVVIKQQIAFARNIKINVIIEDNQINIKSDERRIKQIILSLLNYSLEGTPRGGEVRVNVYRIIKGKSSEVLISLTDDGHGISEEDWSLIMKDGALRESDGTNLTFDQVRMLVELLNGKLIVDSKWEEGNCFKLILPIDYNLCTKFGRIAAGKNIVNFNNFINKK